MDYKTLYSENVQLARNLAEEEAELQKKISSGQLRKDTYSQNWQAVNINDIINHFAPGATAMRVNGKIFYNSSDGRYTVIADIGGGYLRIYDCIRKEYVGINGQSVRNYTDAKGKQHGRNRADFNAVTHFRIKKKGEI